jgi:hypothetical protein
MIETASVLWIRPMAGIAIPITDDRGIIPRQKYALP